MNADVKTLLCPSCGGSVEEESGRERAYQASPNPADACPRPRGILFCPQCGLGIAVPRVDDEDLASYYSSGGYWKTSPPPMILPRESPGLFAMAKARWRFIEERAGFDSGSVLSLVDVGAGHGYLGWHAMRGTRWKTASYIAVEKDAAFQKPLRETWKRRFPERSFHVVDDLRDVTGEHDLVVLSHVVEHLNDPVAMLRDVKRILKPDGCVVIAVPFQDYLFKDDVFPHLIFFDQTSLSRLLTEAGFDVESVVSFGRPRDRSPMNASFQAPVRRFLEKVFYRLRRVIPVPLSVWFYEWYFGASRVCSEGTWLRALGRAKDAEEKG